MLREIMGTLQESKSKLSTDEIDTLEKIAHDDKVSGGYHHGAELNKLVGSKAERFAAILRTLIDKGYVVQRGRTLHVTKKADGVLSFV